MTTNNHTKLFSVDEVAARLGLHVRTVRAYLRSGRLQGVRIGKQYRISKESLDALTGQSAQTEPVRTTRNVDVSSIVQIDAIRPESANRVTNMLMAIANGPRDEAAPLRIDTTYDEERARLKVFVSGSADTTIGVLNFVKKLVDPEDS